jgi:hypothetical protein
MPEPLSPWFPHPAKSTNPPIANMMAFLKLSSSFQSNDEQEYHSFASLEQSAQRPVGATVGTTLS